MHIDTPRFYGAWVLALREDPVKTNIYLWPCAMHVDDWEDSPPPGYPARCPLDKVIRVA